MACCSRMFQCCGRTLLIILNIVTTFVSLAILIAGALLLWFWQIPAIKNNVTAWFQQMFELSAAEAEAMSASLSTYTEVVGIIVLSIGGIILLFAFIGCCSACCHSPFLMATYTLFLGIISVGLLTTVITIALDKQIVLQPIEAWMYSTVQQEFTDPVNSEVATPVGLTASMAMSTLQCCGVRDFTEFQTCAKWNRTYIFSDSSSSPSSNLVVINEAQVPTACCRLTVADFNSGETVFDYSCLQYPNSTNSYIDTACFPLMVNRMELAIVWVLGILALVASFVAVLFVFTFLLTGIYTKRKVHKEYDQAKQLYVYPQASDLTKVTSIA